MSIVFDPPIHPGEILREEFLVPLKLSSGGLAKHVGVPRTRIERLVKEKTAITPDTALRLGRALNTSPQFWTNMQASYDLAVAERAHHSEISAIEPIPAA